MTCPNCGNDTRGPFCTMCGTRVGQPVRMEASNPAVLPGALSVPPLVGTPPAVNATLALSQADLEEFRARVEARSVVEAAPPPRTAPPGQAPVFSTDHFRLHCPVDSFAFQNLSLIVGRLEKAYAVTAGVLSAGLASAVVDVYLDDIMTTPQGQRLAKGGYAVPQALQMYEVYQPEAAGEGLERSLLLIILALATGGEQQLPPLILDGLLACVMQQLGSFPPEDQVRPSLAEARGQGLLPAVAALFAGPTPPTQGIYYPAAADFVGFLLRTYGADCFKSFVTRLRSDPPDQAFQAAYRSSLAQVEKTWHRTLKVATPGGVLQFVKLSWTYLRQYRLQVAEIVLYLTISVVFSVGMARMQGFLLDKALIPRDRHALVVILSILVGGFVVVLLTSLRQNYLMAYVGESVMKEMRQRIFSLLQRLEPGFFQRMQTGDIMSRMTSDLAQVQFALTGALAQGLRLGLTLVVALITIFLTNWKLAIIALAGTPLFYLTNRYIGPAAARASRERQRRLADVTSVLQENLGAQPVVKAFRLEQRVTDDYSRSLDTLFRSSLRLTFLSGLFGTGTTLIASGIQLTVLGVGAWLVIGNALTVGILFSFLGLMAQIIGPLTSASSIMQSLQQATGSMERVDELLQAEPAITDAPDARPVPPLSRAVRLEGVRFGYDKDQPILHGIDLEIPAGSSVALVGPSGCGKSTVLNLIMRFYDPQGGQVSFDSHDLRQATLESIRGQTGVVFQENVLFNINLRENIRMGNLQASDAEVEAAARAAEIHDLIMEMPDGYDTVVGERGSRLSGGQRQRVAIARAIIRNPALLLLDEATSALDPRTEAAINETLDRVGRGRTTIAVTHRLASVVNADRIYVLDRGVVAEQGTHDELVAREGLYAQLWKEQGGFVVGAGVQYVGVEASRLQGVPLFAGLDPAVLATTAQHLYVERFPAGETIVHKEETGDKLYIIHKGQVEVFAGEANGSKPLAILREGDYFGEMALLYDMPRTATVRARTPTQLYSLSRDDFKVLLASTPHLTQGMSRLVQTRAQQLRQALAAQ